MICNNCGAECNDNAKFCKNCGKELKSNSENSSKICPACGTFVSGNAAFCKKCGHEFANTYAYNDSERDTEFLDSEDLPNSGSLNGTDWSSKDNSYRSEGYTYRSTQSTQSNQSNQFNQSTGSYVYAGGMQEITEDQLPAKYKPLGAWAYFGWSLLFTCVPFGFIVAIVFAVGKTENINLRNFARSMFCFFVVIVILILIFVGSAGCTAGMLLL